MSENTLAPDAGDLEVVSKVLSDYRDAWNGADATRFGELFTEDATYVIFLGDALLGRSAIQENHHGVFTKWQAGTKLAVKPLTVRKLATDVISVLTVGGVDTDPEAITLDKFQTITLVRQKGVWKIAAFHNTSMADWNIARYNERE